jgi:hypothetical protein
MTFHHRSFLKGLQKINDDCGEVIYMDDVQTVM